MHQPSPLSDLSTQIATHPRLNSNPHELSQQCMRILRCTAYAMANSPGGLRFTAGTRPWLEDLPLAPSALAVCTQERPAPAKARG